MGRPRAVYRVARKHRDLEGPHQRTVAAWLDAHGVLWFHCPNGGARNAVTGAILKAQGVKRGVPDIIIVDRPPFSHGRVGTVIELKPTKAEAPRTIPSTEQIEWLTMLEERGWECHVAYGSDDAIAILTRLGYNTRAWQKRDDPAS